MSVRIIISEFGDEFQVILEVKETEQRFTRHTVDTVDTIEQAHTIAEQIKEQTNIFWQE